MPISFEDLGGGLPRSCYQQHDSSGTQYASDRRRQLFITVGRDAHGSISDGDAMGMAGGKRYNESQNSQHEYNKSNYR